MTHIISRQKDFSFIHIPKNGGTSIRVAYSRFDDTGQKFAFKVVEHPDLGTVVNGHLPLWVIAKYHPEEYELIKNTWACAVTRDPLARFRSALAQRVRQFAGQDLDATDPAFLQQDVDRVMAHLEANPDLPQAEFCHFARQRDFVFLDGEQIVGNLFPIEAMDHLIDQLSRKTGAPPPRSEMNRSITSRGAIGATARKGWELIKPVIPKSAREHFRRSLRPMVVKSQTAARLPVEDERVVSFVRDFYASDYALHESALQNMAHTARAS